MTIPQLQELLRVLSYIIAHTPVLHELRYSELCSLFRGYMKLAVKVQTKLHCKQDRQYKFSFVPAEADTMLRLLDQKYIPLTPYAQLMARQFSDQVQKQAMDLKQTFISQHPFGK